MITVTFLPWNKKIEIAEGSNLLQAAALAGVPLESNCGGKGSCGKCKVKLIAGDNAAPTTAESRFLSPEELAAGVVLACQRKIFRDTVVEIETRKSADERKTALRGTPIAAPEPCVKKQFLQLSRPTVEEQTPDLERVLAALPGAHLDIELQVLSRLPRTLRDASFNVTAVVIGNRLIAVEPGDTTGRCYGLAFDIGTTTIMGSLLDLNSGKVVAVAAETNPQRIFGSDVISRIGYASREQGKGLIELQEKVIGAMNAITGKLLAETGVDQNEVYEAVAVGNTTMSHLFLGVDPAYLAPAPFIPAYRRMMELKAEELGLKMNPLGRVVVLPNIAGYVGSDTVGVMLAAGLDQRRDKCLAIDIGTNGEMVLSANGRMLTCSTAAGPAFEGAEISSGMRAAEGAIEAVEISSAAVKLKVIGDAPPRGICGSGLIDAVAGLLTSGLVQPSGRFLDPEKDGASLPAELRKRLRRGREGLEFVLAWGKGGADVVLTQGDLRKVQLAKGAIAAGIKILLKDTGLAPGDLDAVLLAGAFGNYIRKESALIIGLLPPVPLERIKAIGNAAGDGSRMALVSKSFRERAAALPDLVEHVELSTRADFNEEFIKALNFPAV